MQASPSTVVNRAREAASWFEFAYRVEGDDDSRFVRTKDGRPEWVQELVYAAHGSDFLPDDWRYHTIWNALEFIAENEDYEDLAGEFADSEVDVYTGGRLKWLSSNLNRAAYCDEASREFGSDEHDIIGMIGMGQYMEAREVFGLVVRVLEDVS